MKQIALDIGLAPEPTLESFFPGGNAEALAHLRLWADGATVRSPVPLYLWGESGSGKTHLLRATRRVLEGAGGQIGWLGPDSPPQAAFQPHWGAVVFDDVHLFNAEQQHTAFNWFVNAISPPQGAPRGVLAAGRLPPADLPLREDLRTRLGWGHVFELQVPSEPERRAVLRRAADARGLFLPDEVMDFILARFARDLSSLMALLDRLDAYTLQTKRPVTIPLLRELMQN